jgi:hypothetical protein
MNLDAKQGEDPKGRHIELVTSAFPEPTLPMIAACLYLLSDSSEYEYEPWYQAGMIIHLVDSDDKGLALFEKWSKAGRGYEEGACKDKWHSFGVEYKEKKVGIGTLVDRVRAAIAGDRTRVTHAAADMLLDEIIPRIRNSELLSCFALTAPLVSSPKHACNINDRSVLPTPAAPIRIGHHPICFPARRIR